MATEETTKDPGVTALQLTREEAQQLVANLAAQLAHIDSKGCFDLVVRRTVGPPEGPLTYRRTRLVFVVRPEFVVAEMREDA